jgi:uncharacterized peroxidase-related enzyme
MDDPVPTLRDDAMERFPVPEFDELPADLQERIATEADRAGFVPNVFAALAYRPDQFRAFFDYYDALVDGTTLDRAEVEMVVVAVAGANGCHYCGVAHGALLRVYGSDPTLAEQLLTNPAAADVTDAQAELLAVAVELTESPGRVTGDVVDRLTDAGYTLAEAWDAVSITAFFNLSNRLAAATEMRPNDEFYGLAR